MADGTQGHQQLTKPRFVMTRSMLTIIAVMQNDMTVLGNWNRDALLLRCGSSLLAARLLCRLCAELLWQSLPACLRLEKVVGPMLP